MLRLKGVEKTVVFAHNSSLIAVYVGEEIDPSPIHKELTETLPAYSVPERILPVTKIPEMPNGKIDFNRLNDIVTENAHSLTSITEAPLYERQLALTIGNIWQELLPESEVTEQSHFFDSGGHSLLAMQMIARTERALGISIALPLLINNPVLIDFSKALVNTNVDYSRQEMITLHRGDPKQERALFCIHGDAYNIVRYIKDNRSIYWLSQWAKRIKLTKKPLPIKSETIEQLSKRYADIIEQTQSQAGSYVLIASCGAAVVALEAAIVLTERGIQPAKLVLMDLPRGELSTPLHRRLAERQSRSWLVSLYHFTYRLLGVETLSFWLKLRAIEKKISGAIPLTDVEAKAYTDSQLYSALANYKPKVYNGNVELVFSGRWRRGISTPAEASIPAYWTEYLTNVDGIHFSPVNQHNDLLQGEGAEFAARIVESKSDQ